MLADYLECKDNFHAVLWHLFSRVFFLDENTKQVGGFFTWLYILMVTHTLIMCNLWPKVLWHYKCLSCFESSRCLLSK